MNLSKLFFSLLFFTASFEVVSQSYFANDHNVFYKLNFTNSCECSFEYIATTPVSFGNGTTITPDTQLIHIVDAFSNTILQEVDTMTGNTTQIFSYPITELGSIGAIVSVGDGLFYAMGANNVYRINLVTGTMNYIGTSGYYRPGVDLTLYNGEIYYSTWSEIIKLDTSNPSNSSIAVSLPNVEYLSGLTASPLCNSLLGTRQVSSGQGQPYIVSINLLDGAVTYHCDAPADPFGPGGLTSKLEFSTLPPCENYIDLDCNDSSGATDADYNSPEFDCLSDGVGIADIDIKLLYDAIIEEMTVEVAGFVPDAPNEILVMSGSVAGINVSGSGTDMITLTNAGGAKSTDFKDALRLILYNNTAVFPTAGLRTVEVQFTTEAGGMSNVAVAFVQVNELPSLVVDIGPDQMLCEGEAATFNAGHPGATYQWSNSETTQTISTADDGQYIVTVSNGVICPGTDTAELVTIPLITVALTGDNEICDNQSATLTLNTNATFPITVEIQADPGSSFLFDDVVGNYSFTDLPQDNTSYTITSVTPSEEACIEITDPSQSIDVFPSYIDLFDVSICDGDSVWLGFYWETEAGMYENTFNTLNGCDSVVTTNISILPAVLIQVQQDTCDPAATGVFITSIDNPNGCDTIVQTTVSLLPSDTTAILLTTCVSTQADVHIDTFSNLAGCDSLIITTTSYIPPADTTFLFATTCDSSAVGVINQIAAGSDGCDSLIVTTVTFALVDTTYQTGTSCIPAQIGVFETQYTDAQGCDSLVISTITAGTADTTYLFTTSCDPGSIGVFEQLLITSQGCDSLIITTVTFSAQDSTFISSTTCDPGSAGEFVTSYINQFGCDSIVTQTVTLSISHQMDMASSSCNPADTGVFVQQLTNQFGCDSIITETITLLPSDQTFLNETTCLSSEAGMFITSHFNQHGCDSIVTLTVSLVLVDTTQINMNTCDIAEVGSIENMYTSQDGCDSLVIETTSLFPLPDLTVQSAIDYNGFDISCEGGMDGSAIANVDGVGPFTYLWSTDATDQMVTGLGEGDYDVAITDSNGCMTTGSVTLTEPDLFMIGFEVSEPDCFDQQLGTITVQPSGGVAPYTYSIDGTIFQASPVFSGLNEGIYQITSLDANDCSATEIISIDVPLMVSVDLGENQSISVGDSALLQAIINLPFDSLSAVMWTGIDSIGCANCLTQIVAPIITTAYSVSVTTADGCADRDSLTIFVNTDHKIYIPNIFSPNGDGINDVLMISADESVQEIASFSIFDRWGNLVFGAAQMDPLDPALSWDGTLHGKTMNPGVFTYKLVVVFSDGRSENIYGDITLIR